MITIKDIAKMANVSKSTVSKALNNRNDVGEETKARIRKIAEEYHFTPNAFGKGLKNRITENIGIIFGNCIFGKPMLKTNLKTSLIITMLCIVLFNIIVIWHCFPFNNFFACTPNTSINGNSMVFIKNIGVSYEYSKVQTLFSRIKFTESIFIIYKSPICIFNAFIGHNISFHRSRGIKFIKYRVCNWFVGRMENMSFIKCWRFPNIFNRPTRCA